MTQEFPYFMENKEWFYFDEDEFRYKLTDKAPKKAKESYEEFYNNVFDGDVNGRNDKSKGYRG